LGIKFDFIFIDGDHSYDGVKSDYEKYKQFLAPDGHIGFHDIINSDQNKKNNINVDILWNDIKKFYKKTKGIYLYFSLTGNNKTADTNKNTFQFLDPIAIS
jgi:predicted O-methyltransferase YrrM